MIAERHKWLLRDATTCFDSEPSSACRACRTQEKGEVRVPAREQERHLSAHRREKIERGEAQQSFLEAVA